MSIKDNVLLSRASLIGFNKVDDHFEKEGVAMDAETFAKITAETEDIYDKMPASLKGE